MNTYSYNDLQFKGLVPVKNYKGPILKLTKAEQKLITDYQKAITQTECELYKLERAYQKKKISEKDSNYFNDVHYYLSGKIENLKNKIREIKINRLNLQKGELK